jgi:hypothetical protein
MIVTNQTPQAEPPRYWTKSASPWGAQDVSPLRRFIGGSPAAVLLKLVAVSLLVGALLVWLDIRPADVFSAISDLIDRLWALGFRSIREFGNYLIAGAVIVVPVWFVLRLLSYRGR